jgi:diacylglycerol kinase family enzyme
MGTSKDIKLACEVIRQRQTKRIDLVRVNGDRFFAGAACLGFDAEVAAFASRRRKDRSNAFVLHLLGGILKFVSYRPKTVELRFNGTRYFGEILLVAFGNIRSYGRGILITPGAEPDDSSLEICVVRPMPRWKFLYVLPSAYKGTHVNSKEVAVYQTESVHVQSLGRTELYADGDFMTTTPFRLEVMPKHLNVIVPHSPA